AGIVVDQSPTALLQVIAGSAVNLTVSSGPPPVAVPNVVNSTQANATTAITGAGLVLGTVTSASSATGPSGSLISPNPAAGVVVAPGSDVNLVVSSGPSTTNLVVDKTVVSDGLGTQTTPAFSTSAAGELIVAFVASDGPSTGGQTSTISGGGLTWTLV